MKTASSAGIGIVLKKRKIYKLKFTYINYGKYI